MLSLSLSLSTFLSESTLKGPLLRMQPHGVVTEVNEYPWQVGLVSSFGSKPYCGGSILSSKTILTAAHCTENSQASDIFVVIAEHDWTISDGEERIQVCSKKEHPNYDT